MRDCLRAFLAAGLLVCGTFAADDADWNSEPAVWTLPAAGLSPMITAFALNSDGSRLLAAFDSGLVLELDTANGTVRHRWPARKRHITDACFLPGKSGLITADDDGFLHAQDRDASFFQGPFRADDRWVTSLAVCSRSDTLASGGYDRTVKLWDLAAKSPAPTVLALHQGAVKSLAFSPDGTRLVSGSADRTATLWNLQTQKPLQTLKGHSGSVRVVRFSPDGNQIATASEDGNVRLWSAETGERQKLLTGHAGMVWRLAYAPDGRWLASGGFDQTVRVWDAHTGQRQAVLRAATAPIVGLAFAPDSRCLYVASEDRTIRRHPVPEAAQ